MIDVCPVSLTFFLSNSNIGKVFVRNRSVSLMLEAFM